jgi:hypothetical protein
VTLASGTAAASCGSAFCTVNTNWTTESALIGTGSVLDLRFEHIDQDHLRSGSESVSEGEAGEQHHQELETINRNYLLTFSHSFKSPCTSTGTRPSWSTGRSPISAM